MYNIKINKYLCHTYTQLENNSVRHFPYLTTEGLGGKKVYTRLNFLIS